MNKTVSTAEQTDLEPCIRIPLSRIRFTDAYEQHKFEKRVFEEQDKTQLISEIEDIFYGYTLAITT